MFYNSLVSNLTIFHQIQNTVNLQSHKLDTTMESFTRCLDLM